MSSNIKFLLNQLSAPLKLNIIFTVLLMFFSGFLDALSIGLVVPIISMFISPDSLKENIFIYKFSYFFFSEDNKIDIIKTVTVFLSIIILSICIRLLNLRQSLIVAKLISVSIGSKIFEKIITRSYEDYIKSKSHEIIASMTQKLDILENLLYHFLLFLSGLLSLVTIFIAISFISLKYSIITIAILIFFYLSIFLFLKRIIKNYSKILNLSINSRVKIIADALGSLKDIIINFSQKKYTEIFYKHEHSFRVTGGKLAFLSMFPRFVLEGVAIILLMTLSLVMIYQYNMEYTDIIIVIGTIVFAAQRMLPIISTMYNSWSNFKGQTHVIYEVLDLLKIKEDKNFIDRNSKEIFNFEKYIEFKNVSYRYPNSDNTLFNKINFKINAGDKVAIIGKTGSGKSTIIDLIIGLLKSSEGQVIVDDKNLNHISFASWATNLSLVPQEIFLKNDSIFNNINFTSNDFDVEEIMNAAKLAEVLEFSKNKEQNLDFNVGDNGKYLSGGQKQRIGLARGFLKKSKILILDEATNQLDKKTEEKIYKNLESNFSKITLIVVTHDKSNLKYFNNIIDLNKIN